MNTQNSSRKRQKRYTRSRGGCFTCKRRKLKCDETRPTCQRCVTESRECLGYAIIDSTPESEGSFSADVVVNHVQSYQATAKPSQTVPAEVMPTFMSYPTINDGQQQSFDSLLSSVWNEVLDGQMSIDWNWMNTQPIRSPSSDAQVPTPSLIDTEINIAESSLMRNRHQSLQTQLEHLCTSQTQLIGVRHFFNYVVQCFHIIPAEANRWRIVFGSLSLQSEIVFRLTTSVGLISLSHQSQTNHRPTAYSHMSYSLSTWSELVQEGKKQEWKQLSNKSGRMSSDEIEKESKNALEVLAVAILVAHVEQFDSGLAHESNKCLSVALNLAITILQLKKEQSCIIDTSSGSHFRFFLRIILWWDIFSCTMGPGSGICFEKIQDIISTIRIWEEEEEESILDSTQCVTGWPIDLLEAIARTTNVEKQLKALEYNKSPSVQTTFSKGLHLKSSTVIRDIDIQFLLSEAKATETQIRSCRPRPIIQDSVAAAELRFMLFELLQAGVLIYFARVLSGSMAGVSKEISLILRFLFSSVAIQKSTPTRNPNIIRQIPEWSIPWVADGHAVWAYLQATIAAKPDQQESCRLTLQKLNEVASCGAVRVYLNLVEEIWVQRSRLEDDDSIEAEFRQLYLLNKICNDVIKQRRWRQLLIF